jgi:hypothetical protein
MEKNGMSWGGVGEVNYKVLKEESEEKEKQKIGGRVDGGRWYLSAIGVLYLRISCLEGKIDR